MEPQQGPGTFPSTWWTCVLAARDAQGPAFRDSLAHLVQTYWRPVYWVIRSRWGKQHEDAKDLTQEFFLRMLERDRLAGVVPEKGRFRTYVQVMLKNFLCSSEDAGRALKRGGAARVFSLDGDVDALTLPADPGALPPEQLLDRTWAWTLFHQAVEETGERCRASGKEVQFTVFQRYDLADAPPSYRALASELGLSEHDVANYLRQARGLFREVLRARVRATVDDEAAVESELRYLGESLGSAPGA